MVCSPCRFRMSENTHRPADDIIANSPSLGPRSREGGTGSPNEACAHNRVRTQRVRTGGSPLAPSPFWAISMVSGAISESVSRRNLEGAAPTPPGRSKARRETRASRRPVDRALYDEASLVAKPACPEAAWKGPGRHRFRRRYVFGSRRNGKPIKSTGFISPSETKRFAPWS